MNLKNCKSCGKLFDYTGNPLCPECVKKDEEDFEKVKEYLEDNPTANVNNISEETEVSVKRITRFLKEGRLECKSVENSLLKCEKCGKPIRAGRYCNECLKKISNGFGVGQKNSFELANSKGAKMHWGGRK